jgi:hypothetical protein
LVTALFRGPVWPEVLLVRMKDRTRYYGRNFSRNFERVCIVKSALTGNIKYMSSAARVKQPMPETGNPAEME